MSEKPRKWAEVIKAWADGEDIQYSGVRATFWHDFDPSSGRQPAFEAPSLVWRIKPAMVRYRVGIIRYATGYSTARIVANDAQARGLQSMGPLSADARRHAGAFEFVRWDGDWRECEVEPQPTLPVNFDPAHLHRAEGRT
jgi:hypothetical protein